MNHLAIPHGALSPAAAELAAAIVGPVAPAPGLVALRRPALLVVTTDVVALVLVPLNFDFAADNWWAM
jgi:hypothetical protein